MPRALFDLAPEVTRFASGRTLSCISCGLHKGAISPKMEPSGGFSKRLMVIGEAPSEIEDKVGKPWGGKTGTLLRSTLAELGIDLDRDALSLNTVNCRPPENRDPTVHEQACCAHRIVNPTMANHAPKVILLMGGVPTSSVIGAMMPDINERITKWRGWVIPAPHIGAWLCPTFHPSFVSRMDKPEVDVVWKGDLRAAIRALNTPVDPPVDYRQRITILHGRDEVLAALAAARGTKFLSHDYETTGLRAKLHHLVCASFSTSSERAFAFMWDGDPEVTAAWVELLSDSSIGKVSHNLKFEAEWAHTHLGVDGIKWAWDSMLAAHVVDNRPGLCGLKLQVFLNFGVLPYDSLISPYLESVDKKDPAAPNRIREFIDHHGENEVLTYCGLDSLFAFKLMEHQRRVMSDVAD